VTADPEPVDVVLGALADPVRRRAVELLSEQPRRSGELANELGVSPATMSKHLRVLRRSGLVGERSDDGDARVRIYSLQAATMKELLAWMQRAEQGWVDQLDALRRHVEGRHVERGS
jgi:DNA-binding transcriptional ArsR family regulator